jgi:hypothetical protein
MPKTRLRAPTWEFIVRYSAVIAAVAAVRGGAYAAVARRPPGRHLGSRRVPSKCPLMLGDSHGALASGTAAPTRTLVMRWVRLLLLMTFFT